MQRGVAPPACLGMLVYLGEAPIIRLIASDAPIDMQLREWLSRPETQRAIADALFDLFDELERLGV